jgi:hypothetical protein
MTIKKVFLLNWLFLSIVFCAMAQSELPLTRPTDFTLASKYDGGMSYRFIELYISSDSCYYRKNEKGQKSEKRFKLAASQLDTIYASLCKNQLNKLETEMTKGNQYDRGGTQIAFAWNQGEQNIRISDTYSSFVKSEWQERWQAFQSDLSNIIKRKIKKKRFLII